MKCFICGKEYAPKRSDQKICKSDECIKAQKKIWKNKSKPVKKKKTCKYCNKIYTPTHKHQKTCGDKLCIKLRKNITRRKEEREFNCEICEEVTWSSLPHTVLCGKNECRAKYKAKFRKDTDCKTKRRKDLSKKAKVSGPFSEKEIRTAIKYKLLDYSYYEIGLKMKRTLGSVESKILALLKDPRYTSVFDEVTMEIESEKPVVKLNKTEKIEYWTIELRKCFEKIINN